MGSEESDPKKKSDEEAVPLIQEAEIPSASNDKTTSKRGGKSGSSSSSPSKGVDDDDDDERKAERRMKRLRKKRADANHSPIIKYGSLTLLVAQLVGMVMLMRYSRVHTDKDKGDLYLSSTAVFCMEVLKFAACNCVVFAQGRFSPRNYFREMYKHILGSPKELLKVSVPSFLYVIQNNLLYLALTNLDAATYQVCYQLKILTTALFSVTLLKRKFSTTKWTALILLTMGVAIVQTSGDTETKTPNDAQNRYVGLTAILCAACTSGFSGVYFEKILKGSPTSLWMRNIQMGLPSMILALATVYIEDGETVKTKGFLMGYTPLVWTVVSVQAVGGLIVAVVVKYADNVLKTFAASFGIVISCIISAIFFDFHPNTAFVCGAALVVFSTGLYSRPEKRDRRRLKKVILPK